MAFIELIIYNLGSYTYVLIFLIVIHKDEYLTNIPTNLKNIGFMLVFKH